MTIRVRLWPRNTGPRRKGWQDDEHKRYRYCRHPAGRRGHEAGQGGSKRGIVWILAGLVVTGLVAGYSWLRKLPK